MRNIVSALLIVIFLTACAGMKASRKSMSEDLGSSKKVELLRQRANEFWSAFVNEDYERIYELNDLFFQAQTNKHSFIGTIGRLKYHEFEITDIKVEGNVAKVTVSLVYSMPEMWTRLGRKVSIPETRTEFADTWLYIYDNWYKEYIRAFVDKPVVYY